MTRNVVRLAALGFALVSSASIVEAQVARPVSFGIGGGMSMPTGDFGDLANSGYNLKGIVGLHMPTLPVQFRADLGYQSFGFAEVNGVEIDGSVNVLSLDVNAVYKLPGVAVRPYVIGGLGMYRSSADVEGAEESDAVTDMGLNFGGGVSFNLAGMKTFLEARYTRIMGEDEMGESQAATIIPITFGITF